MNTEWCIERLENYLDAIRDYERSLVDDRDHDAVVEALQVVLRLSRTAHSIMRRVDPRLIGGFAWDERWQIAQDVNIALGILADQKEVDENLYLGGPSIRAAQLHSWVWDAASTFWDAGHYREAVEQAARAISAHAQRKLGRKDISEGALLKQAFTREDPKSGAPRLRFPGDRSTETWRSRQDGAVAFASGCFSGIRNIAVHQHTLDWDEQEALEYLASFSVLARWVDTCKVEALDEQSVDAKTPIQVRDALSPT
ncbi:TIGR02391 family protein [Planotetraspora silvatica]|uniref:TIGR02391 family protein n=1 Tax=Planotetraspora silvatica TaxID=234614 RepID=UPI00194FFCD5|nr:TIGR02391 family protein [Planotetraspora silvatica]